MQFMRRIGIGLIKTRNKHGKSVSMKFLKFQEDTCKKEGVFEYDLLLKELSLRLKDWLGGKELL